MDNKYFAICLILTSLAIIILIVRTCDALSNQKEEKTQSDTVTVTKTVSGSVRIDTIPEPYAVIKPIFVHDTIHDTTKFIIPIDIDTFGLIVDYYSKKKYNIPYSDSVIQINTDIEISENQINKIEFDYKFNQTNTVITHTKTIIPKWNFAAGIGATYSFKTQSAGININAGIDYKKNRILLGYDIINNSIGIGYQYKIIEK